MHPSTLSMTIEKFNQQKLGKILTIAEFVFFIEAIRQGNNDQCTSNVPIVILYYINCVHCLHWMCIDCYCLITYSNKRLHTHFVVVVVVCYSPSRGGAADRQIYACVHFGTHPTVKFCLRFSKLVQQTCVILLFYRQ